MLLDNYVLHTKISFLHRNLKGNTTHEIIRRDDTEDCQKYVIRPPPPVSMSISDEVLGNLGLMQRQAGKMRDIEMLVLDM